VDEMEALTAIDVNTGRFVGKKSLEDTITPDQLGGVSRGCRATAHSLLGRHDRGRLHRHGPRFQPRPVTRAFNDHFAPRPIEGAVNSYLRARLIEMTRKRTRESLLHALTEPCEHCEGKGYTKSRRTVAYELLRELRRKAT